MKNISYVLILAGLILLSSCQGKQQQPQVKTNSKTDVEKLLDAYQNKDWETVVEIGDTLIGENDTINLTIPYAEASAATGNPQKALSLLNKKLESNPDDYYLYQTIGNVYFTMEKYDSALINYEKVIEIKPTYARPYIYEGEIYELLGDKNKAIANYLVATKLFAANNLYEETIEYGNRVLSLDPTNAEAKELLGIESN